MCPLKRRDLVGIMCEIGTHALWENFCYSFAGKIYLQKLGGPIGARVNMAASRLVMYQWGSAYTQILIKSNLKLCGRYQAEDRPHPKRIQVQCGDGSVHLHRDLAEEDDKEDLTDLKRMGNVCLVAMNSINKDLKFTIETEEDYENRMVPTLDFEVWANPDGTVVSSRSQCRLLWSPWRGVQYEHKSQTSPRKYCNPTLGSCIDHLHEAQLGRSPIQVLTQIVA
jgi:hypothetical protein